MFDEDAWAGQRAIYSNQRFIKQDFFNCSSNTTAAFPDWEDSSVESVVISRLFKRLQGIYWRTREQQQENKYELVQSYLQEKRLNCKMFTYTRESADPSAVTVFLSGGKARRVTQGPRAYY